MEDARQAGGGQRDKREEGGCETSRWRAMRGDRAANDMTRGGGRMPEIILKTTTATTMRNLHQRKQRNQGQYMLDIDKWLGLFSFTVKLVSKIMRAF